MVRVICLFVVSITSVHAALNALPGFEAPESFERITEQTGLVRIRCRQDGGMRLFRGALIETGRAGVTGDVVLTALHGLPESPEVIGDNCIIVAADGTRTGIRRVWRPPSARLVSANDWAVLLTDDRLGEPMRRLAVMADPYPDLSQLTAERISVRLPLLTPSAERECSLRRSRLTEATPQSQLFAHTCRAWSGHSGSPILMHTAGQTFILGIHLGRRRNFAENTIVAVGRSIDAAIATAIRAAVAAGTAEDAGSVKSRRARQRNSRAPVGTTLR